MVSDLSTQVQLFLAMLAGWMNQRRQAVIDYLLEVPRNEVTTKHSAQTGF
jgi:hypothetical protein